MLRISNIVNAASLAIGKSAEASCPAFSIPSSRLIFWHCSFILARVSAETFSASQARVPIGSALSSYMIVSCQNPMSSILDSCLLSCPVFSFLSLYHANVKKSTSSEKLSCFLKWGCPPISLFFEKSGITIVDGAKHLPITAGVSCFLNTMNGGFL